MLKGLIVIVFVFAGCYAATPAAPTQVSCGIIPNTIYACLNNPKVISADVSAQCTAQTSECDILTCIYNKSGWLDGEKVNKTKVSVYYDQFSVEHPVWAPAVHHLKAACLNPDHNIPAQGVYLNCPAYDITHCVLTSFFRNATPSQWKMSAACTYPRAYAAACPVCPEDCFAPQVPYGSCNACLSLPRSA